MKTKMHLRASAHLFGYARALRKNPTKAEALLWERLRGKQTGFKFRRQHPMSNFVVDFYCLSLKYAIELDGNIHERTIKQLEDENKDFNLEEYDIYVQRFTNEEVINDIESVMNEIHKTLAHLSGKKKF